MVQMVMDSQVIREPSEKEDHYSHTGNSWNQSDIDEAYRQYYSQMPMLSTTNEGTTTMMQETFVIKNGESLLDMALG